jgi:starch synthase (maltosyl-transferring)
VRVPGAGSTQRPDRAFFATVTARPPRRRPDRIVVEAVEPTLDWGRHAPKATEGDAVEVSATIIRDGHERLRAVVRHRPAGGTWREEPMREAPGTDRWTGSFQVEGLGRHEFRVEAWVDRFASFQDELRRKHEGGQRDLESELVEGSALLAAVAGRLRGPAKAELRAAAARIGGDEPVAARVEAALDPALGDALASGPERHERVRSAAFPVQVERERARFSAWYELFPRSWGGFAGVERRLPRFAELGFDVLYFPPIHPIGRSHRKGPNNTLVAGPDDPGSPWAIGSEEGGHTAIHPDLGTEKDFTHLITAAERHGIEIALDLAIQTSPDHPWLRQHPEWFHRRPDGTLKYAENPPKRYQDIYNVNFDSEDWRGLWEAVRDVVFHWIGLGVRIFRVDNPHTKPLAFWEWMIDDVRAEHPDVIFLSEAFTRPAMMYELAKIGFSQSYTYFTWRTSPGELTEYLSELSRPEVARFFRPNLFANTPDILHAYLQEGGPPAFRARLVLAATLSPSYGIYSGFEHYENVPVRRGSEEYLDSEKYQLHDRDLDGPLLPMIQRVNAARRARPALQRIDNLRFITTENEAILGYVKGRGDEAVIVCVNVDPHATRVGLAHVPGDLGLEGSFAVRDLLTGERHTWHVGGNYVSLAPGASHLMAVRP